MMVVELNQSETIVDGLIRQHQEALLDTFIQTKNT